MAYTTSHLVTTRRPHCHKFEANILNLRHHSRLTKIYRVSFWITLFSMTLLVHGCSDPPVSNRKHWWQSEDLPPPRYTKNSYGTDLVRYPGVGIVSRASDGRTWSLDEEKRVLHESVKVCRKDFQQSYLRGEIVAWDKTQSFSDQWLPETQMVVPFYPKWIVFLVERGHVFDEEGLPEIAASVLPPPAVKDVYPVGYIFPASAVFSDNVLIESVIADGFRSEDPVDLQPRRQNNAYGYSYRIIDQFLK